MKLKLNFILLVTSYLFSSCATTSPKSIPLTYKDEINKILNDSIFEGTQVAIKVISLKNDRVLFSKNENLLMRPASNLKLITSSTAISVLKDTFNFRTNFYFDSTTSSIFVKGSGNPIFSSSDLKKVVNQIKNLGFKEIKGNVIGDVSLFDTLQWGEGWMWDDEPFMYAAFNSALTINNNCIKIIATPSKNGEAVNISTFPKTNYVNLKNFATTSDSTLNFNITRKFFERTNDIIVSGNLNYNSKPDTTTLTILYPEKYFVNLFYEELLNQGIIVKGKPIISNLTEKAKLIYTHSQSIDSVIINFNKVSDNLTGENLLKVIGNNATNNAGSTTAGISVVKNYLNKIGIDTNKFLLVDGSGMSHYNLITANLYTQLLKSIYNDKINFPLIYNSLPIAGIDGTLSNRFLNNAAFKIVRAKTGSIGGVSTLSGFVTTRSNEMLAFSILMQNFIGSASKYRNAQDRICEVLALISDTSK
ncbi:MAG: D-alanyl-D-alanine carboxypeptidase/D-alanyl-D-alanine-endopeptidase [Bacteroidetes bacterium]|nr:D-alanyl-D-alanine carboxypeptidase/D-alanyl-D-alanine-endopeptidase [Bacteroidota bacterium]